MIASKRFCSATQSDFDISVWDKATPGYEYKNTRLSLIVEKAWLHCYSMIRLKNVHSRHRPELDPVPLPTNLNFEDAPKWLRELWIVSQCSGRTVVARRIQAPQPADRIASPMIFPELCAELNPNAPAHATSEKSVLIQCNKKLTDNQKSEQLRQLKNSNDNLRNIHTNNHLHHISTDVNDMIEIAARLAKTRIRNTTTPRDRKTRCLARKPTSTCLQIPLLSPVTHRRIQCRHAREKRSQ